MPSFSSSIPPNELRKTGPKIQIAIGHPKVEIQAAQKERKKVPQPLKITAVIDTGASITVINPEVVASCELRQTGVVEISSAGHITKRPEYAAAIDFPGLKLTPFPLIRVVACPLPKQDVACLLGRDVLQRWVFNYDGRSGLIEVED